LDCENVNVPTGVSESDQISELDSQQVNLIKIEGNYNPVVKICTWKNNRKAAYTIAFDDALKSHYLVAGPELKKRNILGTFNLNTQKIVDWQQWQNLFNDGHEIASHTWSHPKCTDLSEHDLRFELKKANEDILTHIKGISRVPSFTYPFGQSNEFVASIVADYHSSARGMWGINEADISKETYYSLKGIGVYEPYDMDLINNKVIETINKNSWIIVYFHSVSEKEDESYAVIPLYKFRQHLDFIRSIKDSLWIATQGQVVDYMKIRKYGRLNCEVIDNEIIEITLDEEIVPRDDFKTELSFTLNLPDNWLDQKIIISNKSENSDTTISGIEKNIVYEISPETQLSIYCIATKSEIEGTKKIKDDTLYSKNTFVKSLNKSTIWLKKTS